MVKNKVAPPFSKAEFEILFGEGISHAGELIDMGVESPSWWTRLAPGTAMAASASARARNNSRTFLRENPAIAAKLEAELREKFQPAEAPRDESAEDDSEYSRSVARTDVASESGEAASKGASAGASRSEQTPLQRALGLLTRREHSRRELSLEVGVPRCGGGRCAIGRGPAGG